jgi:hypothetical protein
VTSYTVRRDGVAVGTSQTTSYSDTGLSVGTTYTYTVAARDAANNESAQSTPASATTASASSIFPLQIEAGQRYLVDASGNPFLLHGDAGWGLIGDLSQADAELYLEDRRQKGFNTVLIRLLEHAFSSNAPSNFYGEPPFTTPGDYSTPNEAYFAHADWIIQKAAEKGMLVLLAPSYLGYSGGNEGWYAEMVANGVAKMRDYGRYLGQRYASYSNILWVHGGDYDPPNQDLVRQIVLGIREFDTHSLHTIHAGAETVLLEEWPNESWLDITNVYTYGEVTAPVLTEYLRAGSLPVFFMEGRYENENMGAAPPNAGDARRVRIQAYQALLSGAMGHLFGNNPIWHFTGPGIYQSAPADWKLWLNSPGAVSMGHLNNLFASEAWWRLKPDVTNSVLTGGVGSHLDRAVAARTSDGLLVIAYLPSLRQVTIDLAALIGPNISARWYDPANGAFSAIGSFSASGSMFFTPLGNNSAGFGDWVLVLESIP